MAIAAAGAIPVFKVQDEFADAENAFQYPTTCEGYFIKGGRKNDGTLFFVHEIWGTGAPSTDYNNAPNGSQYTDMTAFELYIKTADTAWTQVGLQT